MLVPTFHPAILLTVIFLVLMTVLLFNLVQVTLANVTGNPVKMSNVMVHIVQMLKHICNFLPMWNLMFLVGMKTQIH